MKVSVSFYLTPIKGTKPAQSHIMARVRYSANGQKASFVIGTSMTCNDSSWFSQSLHGREPNAAEKNQALKDFRSAVELVYLLSLKEGAVPAPAEFRTMVRAHLTKSERQKNILDFFDQYLDHIRARGKSDSFIRQMELVKALLSDMREAGTPMMFDSIDLTWETAYRKKLKERQFSPNTIGAWVKRFKMFMNWALKNNLHQNNIYKLFEVVEVPVGIIALTELEVDKIANLELKRVPHNDKGLWLTRDWFIISTQTALRYSDFNRFREAQLVPVSGGYDIHLKHQKTGAAVVIPVSRVLYQVLERHNFEVPAPPSNAKYNEGLKTIAAKADIEKTITSHTGRKTFCTIQYRKGVPVPNIMKISGHSTEKEFYKYIGVSLSENAALVRQSSDDFKIEHKPIMKVG